ncbi:MAG: PQQ-binding-like beta-propeller repeat protein [Planctomycetaceae bacterium]|jgi:outer membrane protein assembly factor BamB|nr:PQQ-binding-like beta-propeller repeat protein [Planctomycetaceae bacterium]
MKLSYATAAGICLLLFTSPLAANEKVPLLKPQDVIPLGLTRTWFHQVKVLSNQSKVLHTIVEGGQMFIVTSDANLHVLNSETGQWLWSRELGTRGQTLVEPAVNSRVVSVCNGLDIFIFGRNSGKLLYQVELTNIPAAPLQMSENYVYVPLANQTIQAIRLKRIPPEKRERDKIKKAAAEKSEDFDDPKLKKIVEQFEDTKASLRRSETPDETPDDILIDDTHSIPITCAAMGTVHTKPVLPLQIFEPREWTEDGKNQERGIVHSELLSWVTQQGYLYAAGINNLSANEMSLKYRVNSSAQTYYLDKTRTYQREMPGHKEMMASPAANQPIPANDDTAERVRVPEILVTGGRATYIFAVNAKTGTVLWQFPTRGELTEPIAVIGRDVYAPVKAAATKGGLHHFDLLDGAKVQDRQIDEKKYWFVPDVSQFVASSKQRLYVLDSAKKLAVLNKETGAVLHRFDARVFEQILFNNETDQIFLITDKGLIQCLRERNFDANSEEETQKAAPASLRHRLSCAEYAAVTEGKAWNGDVMPKKKKEGDDKTPEPEAGSDEDAPKDNTPKSKIKAEPVHIQLWWEDALPMSAIMSERKKTENKETAKETGEPANPSK